MVAADLLSDAELQYVVSFRPERRVTREDAPPPGRFETTSSARLARTSRYCRRSSYKSSGIHRRSLAKALRN